MRRRCSSTSKLVDVDRKPETGFCSLLTLGRFHGCPALHCETMFGGWAQAEVTAAAESPISVGVQAVHERPELVDMLWQLITTPLHGLLQHVVYGFTILLFVHVLRPATGGRSHCFGARAAASATSRYNGGFLHMRRSRTLCWCHPRR